MKKILAFSIALSTLGASSAQGSTLIEDGFESGDFSTNSMQNGDSFRWSASNVSVSNVTSRSGSNSAQFIFGPDPDGEDSWRELGFRFGKPVSEIWVEYWILYPDNYYHRSQSGSSNNKFFQLNYNGAPKQMLTVESAVQGGGNSMMRRFLSTTQRPDGSVNWPVNDDSSRDFIGGSGEFAIQKGSWTKIMIHYKSGSDGTRNDGRAEVWVNDKLIHGLDWPFWEPDNGGMINGGYILGWANSGFSQATRIYVDDFKIYDAPPDGSSGAPSNPPSPPAEFEIVN
ncbi:MULTISPECIES: hypothetical protein [Marinobacter]|uniref:hypothetical protein n=4 Tax=Pseudomonadati TaxID=3379134 RepID=UPI00294266D4|nr:hypothetical protein [Marinobacter salarius]WOI17661.1 hypothetical protein R1T46_12720 [Marinobacter salarius]